MQTANDQIIARIRSGRNFESNFCALSPEEMASTTATVGALAATILGAVYYAAVRFLERRFPAAGRLLGRAAPPRYPANPGVLAGMERHR